MLLLVWKFELAIWDKSHSLLHYSNKSTRPTRKPKSRIGGEEGEGGRMWGFRVEFRMEFCIFSYVPIMFSSCSQWCSNGFLIMLFKFLMCSPRVLFIASHFIPYPLAKVLPLLTYLAKGEALRPPLFSRASQVSVFLFLVMGQSKWPIALNKNLFNQKKTCVEGSP